MNKKLNSALLAACVRLLNDIAKSMITIQSGKPDGLLPDVLFEALAYECKTSDPDPQIILCLTECIQQNRMRQSSYFPH